MSNVRKRKLDMDCPEAKGTVEMEEAPYGVEIKVNGEMIGAIDLFGLSEEGSDGKVKFLTYTDGMEEPKVKLAWEEGGLDSIKVNRGHKHEE